MEPQLDWEVAMVLDAFRGYVEMASGLTEVNRQRAVAEAKALLAQGGALESVLTGQAKGLADDVGRQVQSLADDILATSRANRQILTTLIRAESERAVGSLGLATAEEMSALRRHVERLERKLDGDSGRATAQASESSTTTRSATKSASSKPAASRPAAPKSANSKSAASKPSARKATTQATQATQAAPPAPPADPSAGSTGDAPSTPNPRNDQ